MKIELPHKNTIKDQQRLVMNVLLLVTIIGGAIFAALNLVRNNNEIALAEILMVVYSTIVMLFTNKANYLKTFQTSSLIFLVFLGFTILFIMSQPQANSVVYVWLYIMPPLSYFIVGRAKAFYLNICFISLGLLVIHNKTTVVDDAHYIAMVNIMVSLFLVWIVSHVNDLANSKSETSLALSSIYDPLTKIYNRKALDLIQKDNVFKIASLVVIDLDFFKRINDTYGHHIGDQTLVTFAKALHKKFDDDGYAVRLGGEEFCVLLPAKTKAESLTLISDFLQQMRSVNFQHDNSFFNVTFSAGVAHLPTEASHFTDLQKLADKRMYDAKANGRNQIIS